MVDKDPQRFTLLFLSDQFYRAADLVKGKAVHKLQTSNLCRDLQFSHSSLQSMI